MKIKRSRCLNLQLFFFRNTESEQKSADIAEAGNNDATAMVGPHIELECLYLDRFHCILWISKKNHLHYSQSVDTPKDGLGVATGESINEGKHMPRTTVLVKSALGLFDLTD